MSQISAQFNSSIPTVGSGSKPKEISALWLVVLSATSIALFYNATFWLKLFSQFETFDLASIAFVATFLIILIAVTGIFLSLLVLPGAAKPLLMLVFFSCAAIAYFNSLGVIIDDRMIINMLQTDQREVMDLLNPKLGLYLLFLGLIPSFIVAHVKIRFRSLTREIGMRVMLIVLALSFAASLLYVNFRYSAYFGREHRELSFYLTPLFPLLSVKKAFAEQIEANIGHEFQILGSDATIVRTDKKRTIGIMVVGETARADHFSLNGYGRQTNPKLAHRQLLNFSNASACGTSTAYSVPCMFSFLTAETYSPKVAAQQSNVLDVLTTAGVKTLWRDNNSSCKGVCVRSASEDFRSHVDPASAYFNNGEYFDEILLQNLPSYIAKTSGDIFIVLHQMGSHGPAYFKRYPTQFEHFTPACQDPNPSNCNKEEIDNSYDNTILYTDHVIDSAISLLESLGDNTKSFLLYASDHGESLGENGVYLHGLPRSVAPAEQTHIPFMLWLSDEFNSRLRINASTAEHCKNEAISHDNIVHTLLDLYSVKTQVKDDKLSLIRSACI